MSTSLLYHGFGIRGYRYIRTEYIEGGVVFTIMQDPKTCRCPSCGGKNTILKGGTVRRFRGLPIGSRKTTFVLRVPRIKCRDCNAVRQTPIEFADPRRSYTRSFAQYVLELAKMMTIQDVAMHLGVSWDVVKEIVKNDLQRRFGKPKLRNLRQIAIDEIAIGKGPRYLTVVLDLETGAIVHVGHGKGGDALTDFWKRLRRCGAKIEAIATDMSPAYIAAVMTHLPDAVLVFDRFHVMKLFNEKLSDLRRDLYRTTKDGLGKDVLKGTRWLLLKRPENLDASRNEHERLEEALRLNAPLATAYYLKEDLGEFWEQDDQEEAEAFLLDWIVRAESTGIRMLHQFARTLRFHAHGLLAYYDYAISTGPLEGTNNKIKTMKRQAYGFRDHQFFMLKLYALHESRYALVG
jgi:transposase